LTSTRQTLSNGGAAKGKQHRTGAPPPIRCATRGKGATRRHQTAHTRRCNDARGAAREPASTARGRAPPQHTPTQHLNNGGLTTGVGRATHERGATGLAEATRVGGGGGGRHGAVCGHRGRGRHEWEAPRGDGGQPASVLGGGVRGSVGRAAGGSGVGGGDVPLHSASDWSRRGGGATRLLSTPTRAGGPRCRVGHASR